MRRWKDERKWRRGGRKTVHIDGEREKKYYKFDRRRKFMYMCDRNVDGG
jgi:hypothetical protein